MAYHGNPHIDMLNMGYECHYYIPGGENDPAKLKARLETKSFPSLLIELFSRKLELPFPESKEDIGKMYEDMKNNTVMEFAFRKWRIVEINGPMKYWVVEEVV